ncbi:MAG: hypothetical protein DWH82_01225 [Planctomycetota bacterium]|nr:MAG: hypothetical protein DWH82_01225 [Planctomycetota bacterium]
MADEGIESDAEGGQCDHSNKPGAVFSQKSRGLVIWVILLRYFLGYRPCFFRNKNVLRQCSNCWSRIRGFYRVQC